jgi:hypothetical protein
MRKYLQLVLAWLSVSVLFLTSGGSPAQAVVLSASQWVTPLEMDFGPVGLGSTAPQMIATITNSGSVPLTGWAGGAVPAPFNASQDCNIPGGVLPGHSCHYFFTFSPTAAGTFSATSNSSTNAGAISITVHGTGVGAQAAYDAHSLDFGDVYTNGVVPGTAPTQVVTIRNTGLAPLTGWAGGAVPAPFNASQDCNIPGGVLPGNACHYFFTFSTSTTGTFNATSSSTTNGGPITVTLTGKAHSVVLAGGGQDVTPLSLDFGPVGTGNSAQLTVAVTNNGFVNITGWAGGAVPAPFNGSQDCNISGGLPPGSTCHFYYTFSPTSAGPFTATSNVSDSFGSFSVALQGTGVAPSLRVDDLWLDFGPVADTFTSQEVVTLTNTGQVPITSWAGGAVPAPFNGSQDCNVAGGLLPGKSCHFYYTFSPTSLGSFSATSNFSTNAGPVSVKLQGQGTTVYRDELPIIIR